MEKKASKQNLMIQEKEEYVDKLERQISEQQHEKDKLEKKIEFQEARCQDILQSKKAVENEVYETEKKIKEIQI